MKTIKKITLVALMFGTLIGYANDNTNSNELEAKKTVKVEFNNVKKGQTLTIKDEQGLAVYNNEIKTSGDYSRTFDFSALENGIYTAELNKDFEILVKEFNVKNGLVTFLGNNSQKVFKPIIRVNENLLYVSKLALNKEPLKVVIYYNGDAIHSETVEGKEYLKRAYKLSKKQTGSYKIVVNSDNRRYVKDFTL